MEQHPTCITWSCRHLHDWHTIFTVAVAEVTTDQAPDTLMYCVNVACRLCSFNIKWQGVELNEHPPFDLQSHSETHALRKCTQTAFTDMSAFRLHLVQEHGAELAQLELGVAPWQYMQYLRVERDSQQLICVSATTPKESRLCQVI